MSSPFVVLQGVGRGLAHEGFGAAEALEARLKGVVRGEVRFDAASRALYATDASNYRQVPIGLVVPLDEADVVAAVGACREFGAPVLSRGGGTSLAGQCCNVAVVLDFSKYLSGIVALDPVGRRARVQPGIVLDKLRAAAEVHELTFAPDPATHSRCTLGGMIGNNSCGVHALMGGKTVDNIESLEVLLYDGTRMRVGATTEEELAGIIAAGGRRGEIYAGLRRLRDTYAGLVRERFPDIPRRVSGYNLDQLLPENGFNVARALVGSEGTCVTVLEAECALVGSPQHRRLVALGFSDAFVAADHVPAVLAFGPIGLEGFDGLLVEFMLRKNLVVEDVKLLPAGKGFLLCEFGGDSAAEVDGVVDGFVAAAAGFAPGATVARYSEGEAARVWRVREAALGASVFVPGETQSGWEGWEDSAVPPAKLGEYLRELFGVISRYGYRTPMYGHFGQGCVHLRITFELRTTEGVAAYRRFLDEAADVVLKYGGSFSGEHGDGQARAALLPKMFGPELMEAFREFKALWDPTNRMNPGKLIDPVRVYEPTENLRIGPGYKAVEGKGWFKFPGDNGLFSEATERCVGVGACRKVDSGTMCPSYMATREEKHSTRGRAHLLWELMQGDVLPGGWRNEAVKEALDLCLSCKACKTECPVNVDIATWKAEFLAHHYEGRRHPLYHYAFGWMDKWARVGGMVPWVANLGAKLPGVKKVLGVARERTLPEFAGRSFRSEYFRERRTQILFGNDKRRDGQRQGQPQIPFGNDKQEGEGQRQGQPQIPFGNDKQRGEGQRRTQIPFGNDKQNDGQRQGQPQIPFRNDKQGEGQELKQSPFENDTGNEPVLLWADTWNNYFHPSALHAAVKVLEGAGKSVSVPRKHICCGRPLYDFGFLDEARKYLGRILDEFETEIRAGVPVVMLEPSCASVFQDELLNFFPEDERAVLLAKQTVMLSEAVRGFVPAQMPGRRIVVHGHCHQKALMTMKDEVCLLKATGATVEVLDSGCCGMAGPFGFEADKFEVSQTLAERVLLPAVRSCSGSDLIVSNGFSCREMVGQNSERRAVHLAEVLAGEC